MELPLQGLEHLINSKEHTLCKVKVVYIAPTNKLRIIDSEHHNQIRQWFIEVNKKAASVIYRQLCASLIPEGKFAAAIEHDIAYHEKRLAQDHAFNLRAAAQKDHDKLGWFKRLFSKPRKVQAPPITNQEKEDILHACLREYGKHSFNPAAAMLKVVTSVSLDNRNYVIEHGIAVDKSAAIAIIELDALKRLLVCVSANARYMLLSDTTLVLAEEYGLPFPGSKKKDQAD